MHEVSCDSLYVAVSPYLSSRLSLFKVTFLRVQFVHFVRSPACCYFLWLLRRRSTGTLAVEALEQTEVTAAHDMASHSEEWLFSPSLTQVSHNWSLSTCRKILPDDITSCMFLNIKHTHIACYGVSFQMVRLSNPLHHDEI